MKKILKSEPQVRKGVVILLVVAVLVSGGFLMVGGIYNQLVAADEVVSSAWGQVENVYQRRLDLIPNLVATVKGYAAHERETLQSVIEARSKIAKLNVSAETIKDPQALARFEQAQENLSSAISRLLVVVEQYPDLKANQNFLALQSQLEGTENRITVERRRFNEAARSFNTKVRVFPNNLVAGMTGFGKKAYFQADQAAKSAPKVVF